MLPSGQLGPGGISPSGMMGQMVRPGVMLSESGTSYMVSRAGQMVRPPYNGGSMITDPATGCRVMVSQGLMMRPGPPARMMSGPRTSAEDMVLGQTGGMETGGMALPGQAGSMMMPDGGMATGGRWPPTELDAGMLSMGRPRLRMTSSPRGANHRLKRPVQMMSDAASNDQQPYFGTTDAVLMSGGTVRPNGRPVGTGFSSPAMSQYGVARQQTYSGVLPSYGSNPSHGGPRFMCPTVQPLGLGSTVGGDASCYVQYDHQQQQQHVGYCKPEPAGDFLKPDPDYTVSLPAASAQQQQQQDYSTCIKSEFVTSLPGGGGGSNNVQSARLGTLQFDVANNTSQLQQQANDAQFHSFMHHNQQQQHNN